MILIRFKGLLYASAALALVAGPVSVAAQQSSAPAQTAAPATLQTPAPEDAQDAEVAPVGAEQADEAFEEEIPAMTAEELAAEQSKCKQRRKQMLKACPGTDLQCRATALKRHRSCLASLQPS